MSANKKTKLDDKIVQTLRELNEGERLSSEELVAKMPGCNEASVKVMLSKLVSKGQVNKVVENKKRYYSTTLNRTNVTAVFEKAGITVVG